MIVKKAKEGMNPRHRAFADEYLTNGNNGYLAYCSVYGAKKNRNVDEVSANRLLSNAKIKEYIESKQQKASENAQITLQEILTRLVRIASANEGNDDRTSILALQEINKILGNYSPTKTENKNESDSERLLAQAMLKLAEAKNKQSKQ